MKTNPRRSLLALMLAMVFVIASAGCSNRPTLPQPDSQTSEVARADTAAAPVPAAGPAFQAAEKKPERRNVLHIISDDLFSKLGCYGDPMVKTPNIDRLADRGVRFDRAYCQYPLCNASRASFMTGLRPDTTRAYKNRTHFRDAVPDAVTIPQSFQKAGYYVARVGKVYHYGVPKEIGTNGMDDPLSWEEVVNPAGRDVDDISLVEVLALDADGKAVAVTGKGLGDAGGTVSWLSAGGTDAEQTDGLGATAAIDLLEQRAADGKPFYLAVGYYRPHTPYVAPKAYYDMYPLDEIQVPRVAPDNDDRFPAAALDSRKPAETAMGDDLRRHAIQAYYAATTFMDAQAGRVLDALNRLGLADDTIIVFQSDHGYHLGEKNLWKKQSLFEESTRVPLIIAVPGNSANGRASERTVELLSLHKTLAELCGIPADPMAEGFSLAPLLKDPKASWDHPAYSQVARFDRGEDNGEMKMGRSVRTERWRYTEWDGGRAGVELYDHDLDNGEMNNLANDPEHKPVVDELHALLLPEDNGS